MKSIRRFQADIAVSDEYLRNADDAEGRVRASLDAQLSGFLRGPRGGRYEPVGPITYLGSRQDYGDDFARNMVRFAATRQGRYVRPKRNSS